MKITKFSDIPQFTNSGDYQVNVDWRYLETWLAELPSENVPVDLDPDFQRHHVWTHEKQVAYVEFILRGGKSSRDIYFNNSAWMTSFDGEMVLVDGKQRLEAVRAFMSDELEAFGSLYSEFTDNIRSLNASFTMHVNDLKTRAEVLQWYLDLNSGGVVHTEPELQRVRNLLVKELE